MRAKPAACPRCQYVSATGRCEHGLAVPRPREFVLEARRRARQPPPPRPQREPRRRTRDPPRFTDPRAENLNYVTFPELLFFPVELSFTPGLQDPPVYIDDSVPTTAGPSTYYRDCLGYWVHYATYRKQFAAAQKHKAEQAAKLAALQGEPEEELAEEPRARAVTPMPCSPARARSPLDLDDDSNGFDRDDYSRLLNINPKYRER